MRRVLNRGAVVSLILSRTAYAINWYNIAAVFAFIAIDFGQNVSGLGVLTASFYIGLGLFQIPGGIVAAKFGPRKTAIYGMLLSSAAAALTAFTFQFYQLVLLRFLVGVGMGLFFGPGVTLIAKAFRGESQGLGVGVFNGAFYVGSALGLFGWSVLAELTGWRLSIAASGGLGILGSLLLLAYLPKDELRKEFTVKLADLRRVLSSRWLLLLSLELLGIGSGLILVNTFMIYYLEQSLKLGPTPAGIIGALSPLCAVFACPLFGILYDKTKRTRLLLFILGAVLAIAVAVVSIGTVYSAIGASLIAGSSSGAFTITYLAARKVRAASAEYETLAVSWVNTMQMFAGFWSPVVFSLLVISFGYGTSWMVGALYTFLLISVILVAKEPRSGVAGSKGD
ncbi:MAG: MFS transporter [Candidatus Bathyarchaeia archaeon]